MIRLIYAICFILIFSFSGFCGESTNNSDIVGTYKIVFFGSQVIKNDDTKSDLALEDISSKYYISNDCKKAQELYPAIVNKGIRNKCNLITQSKILDGVVLISYDKNNYLNMVSRIQLEEGVVDLSAPDRYQYTVYSPIKGKDLLSGKGLINWNYDSVNNSPSSSFTNFLDSPFKITKLENGKLRIDVTLVGKNVKIMGKVVTINAVNTIILEKMDANHTYSNYMY